MLWDYMITGRTAIMKYGEHITIEATDRAQADKRAGIYIDAVIDNHKLLKAAAVAEGEGYRAIAPWH